MPARRLGRSLVIRVLPMKISSIAIWLMASAAIMLPPAAHASQAAGVRTPDRVADRPADAGALPSSVFLSVIRGQLDRPVTPGWEQSSNQAPPDEATARSGSDRGTGELEAGAGWTTAPEPATMVLLATGLLLLAAVPVARRLRVRI